MQEQPRTLFRQFLTQSLEQTREKKTSKMEQSGLSAEELLQQQQELFRSAGQKFNAGPE